MTTEDKLIIVGLLSVLSKMDVLTKFAVLGHIGLFGLDDKEFINEWINAKAK